MTAAPTPRELLVKKLGTEIVRAFHAPRSTKRSIAEAALAVVREALAEPTPEMEKAGRMTQELPGGGRIHMWASNKWAEMLAASPLRAGS